MSLCAADSVQEFPSGLLQIQQELTYLGIAAILSSALTTERLWLPLEDGVAQVLQNSCR